MENNLLTAVENKNDILNIVVDLGNNNVKVAVEDETFSFVNKLGKESNEFSIGDNDYIKTNDSDDFIIIGRDTDNFEKSKSKKDKDFIPTLYFAICKALKIIEMDTNSARISLGLLIPANQKSESQEYIEKIKSVGDYICEYRVDGVKNIITISIEDVEIFQEGVASYPLLEDLSGTQAIVEIGSETINIVKTKNNKIIGIETLDGMGSFKYYRRLAKMNLDRDITLDTIQGAIDDGICKHNVAELKAYLKDVLTETNKAVKFSLCNGINFTGGAMELFKEQGIAFAKDKIKIMNNPCFTNVIGAKKFMDLKNN